MNSLHLLSIVLSVLLGIGHGMDLLFGIDPQTGLCVAGSIWWRYIALAVAVAAAIFAGRRSGVPKQALCTQKLLLGELALLSGICELAAGGFRFLLADGTLELLRAGMELWSGVWLGCLGWRWMTAKEWQAPLGGLLFAVPGTLVFYWNVLLRFMENSSSWHRVLPTAEVWQQLAVVLFLAALLRALYLPEPGNAKTLGAAGMVTFCLCLCWQLPQTVFALLTEGVAGIGLPELAAQVALCLIGGMGCACALAQTDEKC